MSGSLAGVTCLVTGAGGFLGPRIVEMLLEDGEDVGEIRMVDLTFSPRLLNTCNQYQGKTKLKLLKVDILDAELLQRACKGVTLVIHTASIVDPIGAMPKEKVMNVNVKGTHMLLEACIEMDINYFIYTSSFLVMGPNNHGDPVIDGSEDVKYCSSPALLPYVQSKRMAEESVLTANGETLFNGSRLLTCVLRPMYIFGEESKFLMLDMERGIKNNDVFQRFALKEALTNPVYVGNVAWAHIQAAKAMMDPEQVLQVAGQFYFISDDTPPMSYTDFYYELGKELGFGVEPKPRVPLPLLYAIAFLLEIISVLLSFFVTFVPPITRQMISLMTTPFTLSYKKAGKDFNYKPRYTWTYAKWATVHWLTDQVSLSRELHKQHKQQ